MSSQKLGIWAEDQTEKVLISQGYIVLARNFHSRYGEIDLIAQRDLELIFVEVKARAKTTYASALESISSSKQIKIAKTAMSFLQKFPKYAEFYYRFDVFCFDFHKKIAKPLQHEISDIDYDLEWIENAFTINADLINL